MNKYLFIIFIILLFFSSCIRECRDCTKLFETNLSINELDSIVQSLNNITSIDSTNYNDWEEFVSLNLSYSGHELNTSLEFCNKYGGMVAKEEETEVWYSHGSNDLTLPHGEIIELGTIYFDCQ
jgi:hypothetical protein|tara:strand:- start:181 stop:552 length:372 start_codon:yes stop_codon:yes gene_type:complete